MDRVRLTITFPDGRTVTTDNGAEIPADLLPADNPNVWKVVHTPTSSEIQPGAVKEIPL